VFPGLLHDIPDRRRYDCTEGRRWPPARVAALTRR